jgi:hypothetical protein
MRLVKTGPAVMLALVHGDVRRRFPTGGAAALYRVPRDRSMTAPTFSLSRERAAAVGDPLPDNEL